LIPEVFLAQCGGNVTLAAQRVAELKATADAAGVGMPAVGGGWQNPYTPSTGRPKEYPRPHPRGYMVYNHTDVHCDPPACRQATSVVSSVGGCEAMCNATAWCDAFTITSASFASSSIRDGTCTVKSSAGPGSPSASVDTYVRVPPTLPWDWTGTYNNAPPLCPSAPGWQCPRYVNSWFPNATPTGAKIFPYMESGEWQGLVRTNHSIDPQPYLANLVAGFDPRPWEEPAPSFAMPNVAEWTAVLTQVKAQCLNASNRFGFPDSSLPAGYRPAFNIYAWNEFGEGGIMAPTAGEGHMKLQTIAKVFGRV